MVWTAEKVIKGLINADVKPEAAAAAVAFLREQAEQEGTNNDMTPNERINANLRDAFGYGPTAADAQPEQAQPVKRADAYAGTMSRSTGPAVPEDVNTQVNRAIRAMAGRG